MNLVESLTLPHAINWAIYYNPSDFPGLYVARQWLLMFGTPCPTTKFHTAETLEEIRRFVPPGFVCVPRFENDDPVIVEAWI